MCVNIFEMMSGRFSPKRSLENEDMIALRLNLNIGNVNSYRAFESTFQPRPTFSNKSVRQNYYDEVAFVSFESALSG